jgi:hypothetical protein
VCVYDIGPVRSHLCCSLSSKSIVFLNKTLLLRKYKVLHRGEKSYMWSITSPTSTIPVSKISDVQRTHIKLAYTSQFDESVRVYIVRVTARTKKQQLCQSHTEFYGRRKIELRQHPSYNLLKFCMHTVLNNNKNKKSLHTTLG